jgi:hypothetical protein
MDFFLKELGKIMGPFGIPMLTGARAKVSLDPVAQIG